MTIIETINNIFLSPALIEQMGECGYQRVLSVLGFAVPILFVGFSLFFVGLILWGIFKAVSRS